MAAATAWLRLPPSLRAAAYSRATASRPYTNTVARLAVASGTESSASHPWRRGYATLHADKQGTIQDAYDFTPRPPKETMTRKKAGNQVKEPVPSIEPVRQTETIPTKEDYPHAPDALFEPTLIQNEIAGICGRRKLGMQTDIDITMRKQAKPEMQYHCTLKLEVQGTCQETSVAEGASKQGSKHAAWVSMLAKLHANGTLAELLTPKLSSQILQEEDGEDLRPAALSASVLDEEKDAKLEIYNYAAAFGCIPSFAAVKVQPRARRLRAGRQPPQQKSVVRATISLPELDLEAMGVGRDLRTAEVAAALEFKSKAEQRTTTPTMLPEHENSGAHGILNMDTAKHFFTFLQDARRGVRIEVEYEQATVASTLRPGARLSIDAEPMGEIITMATKKQAEAVAYLAAAVHLTAKEPELLRGFEARLRKDKGKVLRHLAPVDLKVDEESLYLMRSALVEARQAGLPDSNDALSAEELGDSAQRQRGRRRQLNQAEARAVSDELIEAQQEFDTDPRTHELRQKKAALPMNRYRAQVVKMISNNPYSIVVGATGSGKTTQVPQILLEQMIAAGSGGACNIICTQPRRIAATSVAQRVAEERDEALQRSVGYHVRFDAKLPQPGGSITYCTTGILLEQLKHDPDGVLDAVSHVVIDEVHERDISIDFLMIILKRALSARKAVGRPVPRVVLMSATLDTELFANYFATVEEDGTRKLCPSLSVPGRTFPVKDEFLGSIMHNLMQYPRSELDGVLAMDNVSQDYLKSETAFSKEVGTEDVESPTDSVIDWKREKQVLVGAQGLDTAAAEKEMGLVPTALLAATLAHICKTTGVDFGDARKFKICLLHSTLPKEEQAQIFEPTPPGCRKIILSTNIAETSVTVTDVRFVVDTGKLRETRYDQVRRINKLECVWESKSNSKQRAGRAGRVQDGFYYALFSKERHTSMRAIGLPELLRSDLQETLLSIKAQGFTDPVQKFLGQAIESPPADAITAARVSLEDIEAFTEDEKLTDLGRLLSKLPVHPRLGKMIVLGVIFRCLEPMLILGAAAEGRSLFVLPIGRDGRSSAEETRRSYANDDSDHLGMLNAFREIRAIRDQQGQDAAWNRAQRRYVHMGAFRIIDQTSKQILQVLQDSGLIPLTDDDFGGGNSYGPDRTSRQVMQVLKESGMRARIDQDSAGGSMYGPAALNRNSDNPDLIKSLLLAGYYPNLGAKLSPKGSTYRTTSEQNVLMHPSSLNDDSKRKTGKHDGGALFAYSTMGRSNDGSSLFMRDSTLVSPLKAVLFGGKLHMSSYKRLDMDEWVPFYVQADNRQYATKLILEFRKALNRVLVSAFRALANTDTRGGSAFVDDALRENFAQKVVEVLDQAPGRANANAFARARRTESSRSEPSVRGRY
ncbi:hypothetical protein LTR91_018010 [Friedmanniomyces endolithicus]|uniref:RNA helicase n=1 Tax=Friedmanniomyces endolithicus TaxID=329885 RepID=A0AAN6HFL1_9PEZI|nr:hypothetical protein LTR91_018010 [Friedmanniomyces endolithicus]